MFTEKNFKAALEAMNFEKISDGVYQKNFGENVLMSANLKTKKFSYPSQLKNRDRNNFFDSSHKENFVVFECVNRLLDKGYKPEDIMLEKAWHLGHSSKSGRADICVSHGDKTLFIIECKTAGAEFNRELENLKSDGGQLFSYRQQEISCQWLILYASDFANDEITFDSKSVSCHEDIYKNASTVQDFFKIWSENFQKQIADDVIFHNETVAYKIGVKPLRKKNLQEFKNTSIVNLYEEILRHNSVTNKQNAFDALLELFICKLADESQKNPHDEVDFQFKFGSDTYEIFIDRLQKLYHQGMEDFMRIPTTYTPLSIVENLLQQNNGANRKILENLFKEEFNKLKFYTPNIFNFIKVLNREIFYMNGKIVREVVNEFKNFKIIGAKNLQTLGDLFEQLLDKGFKQDEGQFFTPIPITRFIWDSLPLEKIISAEKNFTPPKVIDYACGAGHFLTQGFEAINDFFVFNNISPPIFWEDEKLFGVEKNDRLSTVSKISLFMHGADKGKIKFGDGLENYPDEGIAAESFDILVSNPPYSIKNFKKYLQVKNEFDTLKEISSKGSEIETLFVERIAQLLKPSGIAAVIFPSSILNKDGGSFITAREKILKNFYIRTIAEFGSKTFGATGTKTNILFLEKISDPPQKFQLFSDTVNIIFSDNFSADWNDEDIFSAWLEKINVEVDTYKKFIRRELDYTDWQDDSYFADYVTAFKDSKEYKNKVKQSSFKVLSDTDKLAWFNQKFYDFAQDIEREKIQYFAMTYTQTTLIISAPDDNAEQKNFLGYDWSNRKGDEGIKISNAGSLLYDKNNRRADNKLAAAVRKSFYGEQVTIPDAQKYFYYLNLADMIDFSGANFTKIIKTVKTRNIKINDEIKIFKLSSSDFEIKIGDRVLAAEIIEDGKFPVYSANVFEEFGRINKQNLTDFSKPSIIWGIDGDWMVNLIPANQPFYPTDHCGVLRVNTDEIIAEYLAFVLRVKGEIEKFSRSNRASIDRIKKLSIPMPPIEEQKKIVAEFRAVDDEIKLQEKIILDSDADIKEKFAEMFSGIEEKISIGECCEIEKGTNLTREQAIEGEVPVVAGGIFPSCYHNMANREKNIITISASGNAGYVNFWRVPIFATDCNTLKSNNNFSIEYIYFALKNIQEEIYKLRRGSLQPHVYGKDIAKIKIPNAPKELQEKFAEYVLAVENKKISAQGRLAELKTSRENLVEKYFR